MNINCILIIKYILDIVFYENKYKTYQSFKKCKKTPKKNTSEESSKESSASAPQTEKSSTDAASNAGQSEPSVSKKENYVRGESQKPVTKAYRNNWNRIFRAG